MGRVMSSVSVAPSEGREDDQNYRMRPAQMREPMRGGEIDDIEPDEMRGSVEEYFHDESNLAAPPARPGMIQYWKRAMFADGQPDVKNWSKALRQGWTPRDPDTITVGRNFWPARQFEGGSVIAIGGLVLCEMAAARNVRLREEVQANNARLKLMTTQDQDQANAEGLRIGGNSAPRIVRDEVVRDGRRPPTMAD